MPSKSCLRTFFRVFQDCKYCKYLWHILQVPIWNRVPPIEPNENHNQPSKQERLYTSYPDTKLNYLQSPSYCLLRPRDHGDNVMHLLVCIGGRAPFVTGIFCSYSQAAVYNLHSAVQYAHYISISWIYNRSHYISTHTIYKKAYTLLYRLESSYIIELMFFVNQTISLLHRHVRLSPVILIQMLTAAISMQKRRTP